MHSDIATEIYQVNKNLHNATTLLSHVLLIVLLVREKPAVEVTRNRGGTVKLNHSQLLEALCVQNNEGQLLIVVLMQQGTEDDAVIFLDAAGARDEDRLGRVPALPFPALPLTSGDVDLGEEHSVLLARHIAGAVGEPVWFPIVGLVDTWKLTIEVSLHELLRHDNGSFAAASIQRQRKAEKVSQLEFSWIYFRVGDTPHNVVVVEATYIHDNIVASLKCIYVVKYEISGGLELSWMQLPSSFVHHVKAEAFCRVELEGIHVCLVTE